MDKSTLNLNQAAEFLGISAATVRNWRRNGLLPDAKTFVPALLTRLKKRIAQGELQRLDSRANKRGDRRSPVRISEERHFYCHALAVLENAGEIERDEHGFDPTGFRRIRRQAIRDLLQTWWQEKLERLSWKQPQIALVPPPPAGGDHFGSTLEQIRSAGARSGAGAFYTPPELADEQLAHIPGDGPVLDPGCGTGRFLLAAARRGVPFDALYGIDRDALAIRLAALNLLLAFPEIDRPPRLATADFLTDSPFADLKFQCIAANPPWGRIPAGSLRRKLEKRYAARFTNEYFSLFLTRAAQCAADSGHLLFLLPESFLTVRRHRAIREEIFSRRVLRIQRLGRQFRGVFSEAIALLWQNEPAAPHAAASWIDGDHTRQRRNCDLLDSHGACRFVEPESAELLHKIESTPHFTLRGRAEWTLGIVTGDNTRHLLAPGTPGGEPVLRGCDIFPLRIAEPSAAIHFTPAAYQQSAPEARFRVPEKLVYRFIATVPVFAVDRQQRLTVNSANCVTLAPECYSAPVMAAILNSTLYGFWFRQRHSTRKILRSDLETLPLPQLEPERAARLETIANACSTGAMPSLEAQRAIDDELADYFNLTSAERALLQAHVPKWRSPAT